MIKFFNVAVIILSLPFFLTNLSFAKTSHLICECIYTMSENPEGPVDFCPSDADIDIFIDVEAGYFQFGDNDNWTPVTIEDKIFQTEAQTTSEEFVQKVTATLDRYSGKLLVRYDGYWFDTSTPNVFSDLHFCRIIPEKQQF